ncbi:MAG TPA: hypothetical protein GX723_01045 [Thermoanaerobacterales bacterium]|nr:hypothetical protein [Thermoanaerobacterales bacterium]
MRVSIRSFADAQDDSFLGLTLLLGITVLGLRMIVLLVEDDSFSRLKTIVLLVWDDRFIVRKAVL